MTTYGVERWEVELGGDGFFVVPGTYRESARTPLLERQTAQMVDGTLDFFIGWPYSQRSWILGEQQKFTHESDSLKTTSYRRYWEGHGVDNYQEGELKLLPAFTRSYTVSSATCPMCVNRTGTTIYAFPTGTNMLKYAGSWTTEAVTGAVSPIIDCFTKGDEVYVVDAMTSTSAPGSTCTDDLAGAGAGNVDNGTHYYKVTFVRAEGETEPSTASGGVTVTDKTANGQVALTNIPTGGSGTTARRIYRTTATNATAYRFLTEISGNSTTTYTDNTADADLTYSPPGTGGSFSRVLQRSSGGTWSRVMVSADTDPGWDRSVYNTANAVATAAGDLYIITATAVYNHTAKEIVSSYQGGTIACSHAGGVFWSDGSHRVFGYNGVGSREVMGDLPVGFTVEALIDAQARMWVCGTLPDGKAAIYWYSRGQWGAVAWLDKGANARHIKAGAGTPEHVVFADSRYGGTIRHYVPEGGWSHYLATGTEAAIPYKGMAVAGGKIAVALYKNDGAFDGIYVDQSTYVTSGQMVSSIMDLGMPGHDKRWFHIAVNSLPLRAGEKVVVEMSLDGMRNWEEIGCLDLEGQETAEFTINRVSPTITLRLTLYAGTSAATTPVVLSTTVRGDPVVSKARRWKMRLDVGHNITSLDGLGALDVATRLERLKVAAMSSEPMMFRDIRGDRYYVVVRPFEETPYLAEDTVTIGSRIDLVLDEIPG